MKPQRETINYLAESRACEQAGKFSAAIRLARQALESALASGDGEFAGQALLASAQAFFRLGNYGECDRLSRRALEQVGPESGARADGLRILGICALETDQMSVGEDFLRQSIALSRQIGDQHLLARSLHNLSAGVYMPRGQFDLSLQADQESLRLCRENGYADIFWGPLLTMSWVYWLSGQPEPSRARLTELEHVARPGSLAEGYVHLIRSHLALDSCQTDAAEPEITMVISSSDAMGSPELCIFGRVARSRLLRLRSEPAQAIPWAQDARKIAADVGYHHLEGVALIELGRAAAENGLFLQAQECFETAIAILDPLEMHYDAALASLLLAVVLFDQGSPGAPAAWQSAAGKMMEHGLVFLLDREARLVGRLIAEYETPGSALACRYRRILPAPLCVVTFGGLKVWVGGRPADPRGLSRRRGDELLVLLLLAPGRSLLVEQICESLFPDKTSDAVRAGFHQATSTLRRVLEPDLPEKFPSRYLDVEDGRVALRLPPGSVIDFEVLDEFIRARDWKAALAQAGGEFLPELLHTDWAALPRQRWNDAIQQALFELAREYLEANLNSEAVDCCQRLLALEQWHEGAVMIGMEACIRQGNRAGARRLYHRLEMALAADLDSIPSAEVQALYRSLDRRLKS